MIGALAVSALGAGAVPPAVAADSTYALVGDLQSELGCAADWAPDCVETELLPTGEPGTYSAEFTLPAGDYLYKVAADDAWERAWGLDGGDANIPLSIAGESTVRITFDAEIERVGLELLSLAGASDPADESIVAPPVRQPGSDESFYFVMTDRFANGDPANDLGGLEGDRMATGFDPTDKGFFHGGDIAGIRQNLDYIEGLGTSAIWFTPSFKNRPVQGEGANASAGYHGYWITDFTQLDPHLGTNEELAALIDEAHARGIKIYFDIITNHTADVIDYEEGQYSYIDKATSPYLDAAGAAFEPGDFAGTGDFPQLDAATSFPYTPVIAPGDEDVKVPAWLNDPTLYHNRGDSTFSGESTTFGDFVGLDDLMTEHPRVVDGFVDVYQQWIDLGIDGFRIDTAKHVNFEFWEQWSSEVLDYAREVAGKPDFFMFGEVYDADPVKLAPYIRDTDMNSVLDFTFQQKAVSFAAGNSAKGLQDLFAGDDRYTTPDSSATALPTFLGNHDMGRVGFFLANSGAPLERTVLAHELMYLTRGQPVVYYGDEQGFAGTGGDKDARQTLFATQTAEYADQPLITGEQAGTVDRFGTDAPLYQAIADLAALRSSTPALQTGAQIERLADGGVYAFSRVDRAEKVEHLVAVNNAATPRQVVIPTLTADAAFAVLHGDAAAAASAADGSVTVTVPALSAVVWRADRTVTAPEAALAHTVAVPAAGAALTDLAPVSADVDDATWRETSFAWRVAGAGEWTPLGTAENSSPRVFHDVRGLDAGTLVEYRAVSIDAAGNRSAASTYASVGNAINLAVDDGGETEVDPTMVTVPGSFNSEIGCAGDWAPDCEAAALTKRADGIWSTTLEIPAGSFEYKVAIDGSWALNYGANGVQDGPNATLELDAPTAVTFYWDPRSKVVSSSVDGPVVTIAGSFQSELGCAADWQPECMASFAQDGDRDGVYVFRTDRLPAGAYEGKVAHGLSWAENYGLGGARDGGNYSFTVSEGSAVEFRYTLETHVLEIVSADAPLAGTGSQQAHWLAADVLAWPVALLGGADAGEAEWTLEHAAAGGLAIADGAVTGGDGEPIAVELVEGGLPEELRQTFPHLAGSLALAPVGLDRAGVAALLQGELMLVQRVEGSITAATGIQVPVVLDDLYAEAAAEARLGAVVDGDEASAALWAPTARAVALERWSAGATGEPELLDAVRDDRSGVWTASGLEPGDEYRWSIEVLAPSTGQVETNSVTDPYSTALTPNSARTVVVDLDDPATQPALWRDTPAPEVERSVDRAIYELHVRDFSIGDPSVPEEERGTYRAFTRDSSGTAQLRELAEAGITTVHLLPTFDLATIEESRAEQAEPACDLASFGPASEEQQACIASIRDLDGFNWGYDPYHFQTPEGSYAVDADGAARVGEFREMVGALHATGLEVVLDKVFNHTAEAGQGQKSVLDRIVPGYYHRLNAVGAVETSTCCQNVATEHALAQKLMVDSVVVWARDYRVDGFRFDLMGHHSTENMQAVRDALDALTLERDGVDGESVFLYGEGWNFGEVANNARFEQATQGQLGGTGIATFNDRLRDAVHGGSPVDGSSTFVQGFGTGLGTDPNGDPVNGSTEAALADLANQSDLVRLGLVGNLRDYEVPAADGALTPGDELDYRGSPAGYADQPDEVINYVDAHDNETLYDLSVLKLPRETTMAERVRMNTLSLATVTLSQAPSFWHAGTELLRSKSLDRNSYNAGDWFNRIDWTGQESTFGSGLPSEEDNGEKWPIIAPLLADPALKPAAADMAAAEAQALDLLRVRQSVDLLQLGSAELIEQKVSFPNSGPGATPGLVVMLIDDLLGEDVDPELEGALVAFNASPDAITEPIDGLAGRAFALAGAQARGSDPVVRETAWQRSSGTLSIPGRTVAVLVDDQPGSGQPGGPGGGAPGNGGSNPGNGNGPGDGPGKGNGPQSAAQDRPSVVLGASVVEPGQSLRISGTGFAPGERVQIWLESTPRLLVAVEASGSGELSTSVVIPADAELGDHTIRLRALDSGAEATAALRVGALALTGVEPWLAGALALSLLAAGGLLVGPRLRRGAA
ncbi:pullulanase-type alpha-1,6-glucosidase [Microcella daejeonensis]|uniref:pullulanase-type alpha-1,6-glucosidase n=1 Tax=Microcella daejeonensis TaxID=2994971 RepID=UPI00226DA613|nr:pullulanase-type alpha-1,6-glucosidase [Microcella daejeonensis]WAB84247.1 pullulanase-type alpha-1,6-glucosidase [Microcella daejeonensis]